MPNDKRISKPWFRVKAGQFQKCRPMQKSILSSILFAGLCFVSSGADNVADRITVTVRGRGPDVMLIPGLACSNAVWDATAKHLESRYRLHLVQVAGFAGSPARGNANGAIVQPT